MANLLKVVTPSTVPVASCILIVTEQRLKVLSRVAAMTASLAPFDAGNGQEMTAGLKLGRTIPICLTNPESHRLSVRVNCGYVFAMAVAKRLAWVGSGL